MMINIIFRDKKTVFITMIVSSLGLAAIFYFIFLPALRETKAVSLKIKEKKAQLSSVRTPTLEFELLENELDKTKSQVEILKNKIFWESDLSGFLNEITQMASNLRIEFVSLKPEPTISLSEEKDGKPPQGYLLTQVPISIIIKSNYSDLVKFLRKIEQADKFISIDALNIDIDRQDIYKHNIKVDLSIFTPSETKT